MTDATGQPGGFEPPESGAERLPPPPGPPPDPNRVAVSRAGVDGEHEQWLLQVADQVEPRLDRISDAWRGAPQADAAKACAFGLLLGQLAVLYPHAREALHRVAESHPSFTTLDAGKRLVTLQQIAGDPERMGAWLGPLVGISDTDRIRRLLD